MIILTNEFFHFVNWDVPLYISRGHTQVVYCFLPLKIVFVFKLANNMHSDEICSILSRSSLFTKVPVLKSPVNTWLR